jgi:hypothetical protein
MSLQTEYEFTLPKGYVDKHGELHTTGTMRLATARDEIEPLRDLRVADNEAYLTVIVLSRVITRLGNVSQVTPNIIEGLFAADLAYLQEFYGIVNFGDPAMLEELDAALPSSAPASTGRRAASTRSASARPNSNGKAKARAAG